MKKAPVGVGVPPVPTATGTSRTTSEPLYAVSRWPEVLTRMWYGVVRRLTSEAFTQAVASLGRREICSSIQSP
jgi:hypothetical protein